MQKPAPKKHSECDQCLRVKPLLMPVGGAPGWPIIVWQHLCLDCRVAEQMSKYSSDYWMPAYHLEHSPDPAKRQTYQEWLAMSF